MESSKFDVARSFAEAALQLKPGDPGLMANLALVLLLAQDPRAAKSQIERAIAADPKDRRRGDCRVSSMSEAYE
jgi:Flp pilus assembly protein TadD